MGASWSNRELWQYTGELGTRSISIDYLILYNLTYYPRQPNSRTEIIALRTKLFAIFGEMRAFWKLRSQFSYVGFLFRRSAFGAKLRLRENRTQAGTFLRLSVSTLLAILACGLFASVTQYFDPMLDDLYKRTGLTIPNDTYSTLLATIAGMGGVFIGLYYAATIAISGAIYARVPNNIRDLLARERVGNVYMRFLALLTYTSVILLAMKAAGLAPNKLAAAIALIGAGISVIAFVKLGARAFYLFDPTSLASELVHQIKRSYDLVGPRGFRWLDPSFQNYSYRTARQSLDTIEALAEITGKDEKQNAQAYVSLCEQLLLLLADYSAQKGKIPTESRWYPRQHDHADWYQSDDTSTSLSYQGAGRLAPKEVSNSQWLEESILSIVHAGITKSVNDGRYDLTSLLVQRVNIAVRSLGHAHEVDAAFKIIDDLTAKCSIALFPKKPKDAECEPIEAVALGDAIATIPITLFLAYAEAIAKESRDAIVGSVKAIKWKSRNELYERGLPRHLLPQLEWLYPRIEFERRSEGFRTSPDWYVSELVRQAASENLKLSLNALVLKAQDTFDKWLSLASERDSYWIRAAIIDREAEYWSKIEYHFSRIRKHWDELSADKRIDDLPWPKVDFKELEESKARRKKLRLKLMAEESTRLGALKRPNAYPDFAGQFLHTVGEGLLASLVGNDAQAVNDNFGHYFASSLMQFDHLRAKADFEDWRGLSAMKVAIAPVLDLMTVSGYGLLLAEVHKNAELSRNIIGVWNRYLDGIAEGLKLLVAAISMTDSAFEIAHRSLIRTTWRQLVAAELGKIKRKRGRGGESFYRRRSVADHESPLVRLFADESFYSPYDGLDVFVELLLKKRAEAAGIEIDSRRKNLGEAIAREERRPSQESSPSAADGEQEFDDGGDD